jgi:hypothetical protein
VTLPRLSEWVLTNIDVVLVFPLIVSTIIWVFRKTVSSRWDFVKALYLGMTLPLTAGYLLPALVVGFAPEMIIILMPQVIVLPVLAARQLTGTPRPLTPSRQLLWEIVAIAGVGHAWTRWMVA